MRARQAIKRHAPILLSLLLMSGAFAGLAGTMRVTTEAGPSLAFTTRAPVDLPPPGMDADRDSYHDDVDLWIGDMVVVVTVQGMSLGRGGHPYFMVGTDDDHWRTGNGRELTWPHIVDHDPLGREPGSNAWTQDVLRTGLWLQSPTWRQSPVGPNDEADNAVFAETLPMAVPINVRDDEANPRVSLELYDRATRPDALAGRWDVDVDVLAGTWSVANQSAELGTGQRLGDDAWIDLSVHLSSAPSLDYQQEVAERWSPLLLFDDGERFYPTRGESLARFHGFYAREGEYRTWRADFNNGRDAYQLLLGDFTGDGEVDHRDAAIVTEVLSTGDIGRPTVYTNVQETFGGHVVVQFWFLYHYNFVRSDAGQDVAALAHNGDREFIQLLFEDRVAAQHGTPLTITYSQHYKGTVIPYEAEKAPFHIDPDRPAVYVAQGSHASYPVAGDDRRFRSSFVGYGDEFDGQGEIWTPDNFTTEVFSDQTWHMGSLWGPMTRFSRDFGTSSKPILKHDFRYPFTDPLDWQRSLPVIEADRLDDLFGGT